MEFFELVLLPQVFLAFLTEIPEAKQNYNFFFGTGALHQDFLTYSIFSRDASMFPENQALVEENGEINALVTTQAIVF